MPDASNGNPKILGLSMPLGDSAGVEEERAGLSKLKGLFDQLGTDSGKNIQTLVSKTSSLVGACCSSYYHAVGSRSTLLLHASGQLPRNFSRAWRNEPSSLCPNPKWLGQPAPFAIEDLQRSPHAGKHAGLLSCGLRSCLVCPVFCGVSLKGLLYIFWSTALRLSRTQFLILSVLTKTLGIEEMRWRDDQRSWLDEIEGNPRINRPSFASPTSLDHYRLTPAEARVAVLIRHKKTSREISELLGISVRTVEVHRNRIRRKLSIAKKNVNLRAHLLSLED